MQGLQRGQSDRDLISLGPEDFRVECQETSALGHCGLGSWVHPDSSFYVTFDLHMWVCPQGTEGLVWLDPHHYR